MINSDFYIFMGDFIESLSDLEMGLKVIHYRCGGNGPNIMVCFCNVKNGKIYPHLDVYINSRLITLQEDCEKMMHALIYCKEIFEHSVGIYNRREINLLDLIEYKDKE